MWCVCEASTCAEDSCRPRYTHVPVAFAIAEHLQLNHPRVALALLATVPASSQVLGQEALDAFVADSNAVVVGLVSDKDLDLFNSIAKRHHEILFLHISAARDADSLTKKIFGADGSAPSLAVVSIFDSQSPIARYSGKLNDENTLRKFIFAQTLPVMPPVIHEYVDKLFSDEAKKAINRHVLAFIDESALSYRATKAGLMRAARKVRSTTREKQVVPAR